MYEQLNEEIEVTRKNEARLARQSYSRRQTAVSTYPFIRHDPSGHAAIAGACSVILTPSRRKSFADLIDQWESEPEWTPESEPCPE